MIVRPTETDGSKLQRGTPDSCDSTGCAGIARQAIDKHTEGAGRRTLGGVDDGGEPENSYMRLSKPTVSRSVVLATDSLAQ